MSGTRRPQFVAPTDSPGPVSGAAPRGPVGRRTPPLDGRTGDAAPPERSFFCRTCKTSHTGRWVPAGWYALERVPGGQGKHLRLRLYCTLQCLIAAAEGPLAEGDRCHTGRLGLPADSRRDRARLVERSQVLIDHGATLREAADHLDVGTDALRGWLHDTDAAAPPWYRPPTHLRLRGRRQAHNPTPQRRPDRTSPDRRWPSSVCDRPRRSSHQAPLVPTPPPTSSPASPTGGSRSGPGHHRPRTAVIEIPVQAQGTAMAPELARCPRSL